MKPSERAREALDAYALDSTADLIADLLTLTPDVADTVLDVAWDRFLSGKREADGE